MELLYVAGPMAGYPEHNFPAFREATARLRAAGYVVVSPHEVALPCGCGGLPPQCGAPDHGWAEFLRADLHALLQCEAVAVLPGWEDSRGANLETHIAKSLGMTVLTLDSWLYIATTVGAKA